MAVSTSSLPLAVLCGLSLLSAPCAQDPTPDLRDAGSRESATAHELRYGPRNGKRATLLVARPWNPEDATSTCKVYHHVFAPDGARLTKGEGGTFQHHRGLFVGWNRTRWNGRRFDFWHLPNGESQRWVETQEPAALQLPNGAEVHHIQWCAPDGTVVVDELRGLAVLEHDDDSYALLLRIECRAPNGDVRLDGDPQHAGQQFRAPQRYAEDDAEPVRYVRPEAAERHENDVWTSCDWIAQVQPGPDGPVTVLRIESPDNPGKTTWSTRPYGRFGATRTFDVTAERPLRIDQIYKVAMGEHDRDWCARQAERLRKSLPTAERSGKSGE